MRSVAIRGSLACLSILVVGKVWFDHVVLAKRYIGPINTQPAGDTMPPAVPTSRGRSELR
jgi:hypothetical protein